MEDYSFNQPGTAAGDKISMKELVGRLLLVYPKRIELGVQTQGFGLKDPLVADVVVLDGPTAGEQLHEVFIFPGALIGQLKHLIGNPNPVLGRLGYGTAKPGQNPPYELGIYDHADEATARRWLNDHPAGVLQPPQGTPAPGVPAQERSYAVAQTRSPAAAQTPAGGAVNIDAVRTLLGLNVPDQAIADSTGATLEQVAAIRNLPVG